MLGLHFSFKEEDPWGSVMAYDQSENDLLIVISRLRDSFQHVTFVQIVFNM